MQISRSHLRFFPAAKLNETTIEIYNNTVRISWQAKLDASRVYIGFRSKPYAIWPKIKAFRAKPFGKRIFTSFSKNASAGYAILRVSRAHAFKERLLIDSIEIKLNIQLIECKDMQFSNETASNETVGEICIAKNRTRVLHLDEHVDSCHTPDKPLSVSEVNSVQLANQTGLRANYTCKKGFTLIDESQESSPQCPKNGDWSNYHYEPCEAIFCDPEELAYPIDFFNPFLQYINHTIKAVYNTNAFLDCTNGDIVSICTESGKWSKVNCTVISKPSFSDRFKNLKYYIGGSILAFIGIIGMPILVYYIIKRTRKHVINVNRRTSSYRRSESELTYNHVFGGTTEEMASMARVLASESLPDGFTRAAAARMSTLTPYGGVDMRRDAKYSPTSSFKKP